MASSRSRSPPQRDSGRETTNEWVRSVTNILVPQTQNDSGFTDNRGLNLDNQNRLENFYPRSHSSNSVLPNISPQLMQSSYIKIHENFCGQCQCKIRLPTQVYMLVYEDLGYLIR